MTSLLDRASPHRRAPADPGRRHDLLATSGLAAAGAGRAAGRALLACVVVCATLVAVTAVTSAGPSAGMVESLRAAGLLVLAAHAVPLQLGGEPFSVAPLGLAVLPLVAVVRVARTFGTRLRTQLAGGEHESPPPTPRGALGAACPAFVLAYTAGLAVVAAASSTPGRGAAVPLAAGVGACWAVLAGLPGLLATSGSLSSVAGVLDGGPRAALRGAVASVAALVGVGALAVAVSLSVRGETVSDLFTGLASSPADGAYALLASIAFLPNAAIWAASYAAGPGFALGAGTVVAPGGTVLGAVPALPLLGGLPLDGPAPLAALVLLAAPAAAGLAGGAVTAAAFGAGRPWRAAGWGFVGGVLAGPLAAALGWLSGGAWGDIHLAVVGPPPLAFGLAVSVACAPAGAVAAAVTSWRRGRGVEVRSRRPSVKG